MTPREVIDATAIPILEIGRAWMSSPTTAERANDLGLPPGFSFWVTGRAGVLGPVDADVVAAAIGFMYGPTVRGHWEALPASLAPLDATTAYAEAAATWARHVMAGIDDGDLLELHGLARKVAAGADPSVGAIFAGWRVLAGPDDPAGAATVSLNVLRELRGGAHLSAAHAAGLGPAGAIVSAPDPVRGGEAGAARFGWPGPFAEPSPERRSRAEEMTSVICEPAYSVLDEREGKRFVELVTMARAAMD